MKKQKTYLRWMILSSCSGIIILTLGFVISWPSWYQGMSGPEYGFLQNLLSEGLGVVITTLIIGPLTAYFVERKRETNLRPVRSLMVESIIKKARRYSLEGIHIFSNIGLKKMLLESAKLDISTWELKQTLANLSRLGYENSNQIEHIPHDLSASLEKAARNIAYVASSFRDLRELIEQIQNTIDLHAHMLTPDMLAKSNALSDYLNQEISSFRTLERYCLGYASKSERMLALAATTSSVTLSYLIKEFIGEEESETYKSELNEIASISVETTAQKEVIQAASKVVDLIYYDSANTENSHSGE